MSYSRSYQETIYKTVTVNYDYPASENGGSSYETVEIEVPITIDIDVDTNPFDRSISSANNHINVLTGSVVATEAAHIAAKVQSAEDVSNSIVDGFFGLIKSEINQQITEIKPRVDALIIELVQHQETCAAKKIQLQGDFARIAERYSKIFLDLDKELRNRILILNQSAVGTHAKITTQVHKSFTDISSGISTIYNKEGGGLHSMLLATGLKNRALSLIDSSKNFLYAEKKLSGQLKQILVPENTGTVVIKRVPVIFLETKDKSSESQLFAPEQVREMNASNTKNKLKETFLGSTNNWKIINPKIREGINTYFKLELSKNESEAHTIKPRVAEQIMKLWLNDNSIQSNAKS